MTTKRVPFGAWLSLAETFDRQDGDAFVTAVMILHAWDGDLSFVERPTPEMMADLTASGFAETLEKIRKKLTQCDPQFVAIAKRLAKLYSDEFERTINR